MTLMNIAQVRSVANTSLLNFSSCARLFRIMKQPSASSEILTSGKAYHMEQIENTKNPIQVADRLFGALEYLSVRPSAGLSEIAAHLRLNKSTAHRVLASLEYLGYVQQDPAEGRYELTLKVLSLSEQILQRMDIRDVVHPYLRRLMEQTGETVHFVRQDGVDAVYLDNVETTRSSVRMISRVGSRIPLYRSGVGKAMMADMPEEELREVWNASAVVRTTPNTITTYPALVKALRTVRETGYALDNEENEIGIRCIASAIRIPGDGHRYAFSISAPVTRMDDDRVQQLSHIILEVKENLDATPIRHLSPASTRSAGNQT